MEAGGGLCRVPARARNEEGINAALLASIVDPSDLAEHRRHAGKSGPAHTAGVLGGDPRNGRRHRGDRPQRARPNGAMVRARRTIRLARSELPRNRQDAMRARRRRLNGPFGSFLCGGGIGLIVAIQSVDKCLQTL
jgi:hypothetical protein